MKLASKFTLWFLGILILITPITITIGYYYIHQKIDQAETERLQTINDLVASQVKNGFKPAAYTLGRPVNIRRFKGPLPAALKQTERSSFFNKDLNRQDCRLTVTSYYHINSQNYQISSYDYIVKADEILSGMMRGVIWKIILITLAMAITAGIVSKYVMAPFYQTLKSIQSFSLKRQEKIYFPRTSTREFRKLNEFVQLMTDKLSEDYRSLKEFSENASHELQTPLAVIRSKLDLLANTPIQEDQAGLVADMQDAVEKLSRINRYLLLLTKLENHEFEHKDQIRFCTVTNHTLSIYQELIKLKSIQVSKKVDKHILIKLHPVLAEMLVGNLISNAIRHNLQNGHIQVELNAKKLIVRNTGIPPKIPTDELFQRFKKGNQSSEGIGLGLAIVKQICTISGFSVQYTYKDDWHIVCVVFNDRRVLTEPAAELSVLQ
ncbi:Signal transduction histidine kinase [bacterium A37T11]|nr:Signal transduction histidine kinase [bacterium A37T11]